MAAAYTIVSRDKTRAGKKLHVVTIAYTTEAYSSGLQVTKAELGMPNVIEALAVIDGLPSATSIVKYDVSSDKIRVFVESAGTYAETSGNQTATFTVLAQGW